MSTKLGKGGMSVRCTNLLARYKAKTDKRKEDGITPRIGKAAMGRILLKTVELLQNLTLTGGIFRSTIEAVRAYMYNRDSKPVDTVDKDVYALICIEIDLSEQRSLRARERALSRKNQNQTIHNVSGYVSNSRNEDMMTERVDTSCQCDNGILRDINYAVDDTQSILNRLKSGCVT